MLKREQVDKLEDVEVSYCVPVRFFIVVTKQLLKNGKSNTCPSDTSQRTDLRLKPISCRNEP